MQALQEMMAINVKRSVIAQLNTAVNNVKHKSRHISTQTVSGVEKITDYDYGLRTLIKEIM